MYSGTIATSKGLDSGITETMEDRTTEDHSASLKDACGDGPEDLLSGARSRFLLDSVLLDLYRLWPILYKCNVN